MKQKPSFYNLLERSFSFSLVNIWRNKMLSLATIFVTAAIIFIFNIILAINFITQDALIDLNKKIDLVVYLNESTPQSELQRIVQDLESLNGVEEVNYISKQDALEKIEETHPNLGLAFERYELENPLPASINITTKHPQYHQAISQFLNQDKYRAYLSNIVTSDNADNDNIISSVSKNLLRVTDFTEQVIFWLIITFILGGSLIILNALQITIFTRKSEISIMKLVGASNWFIRSPFLIEATIYGILAVATSFVMLFVLSKNIAIQGTELWNYYSGINFYKIYLYETIVTIILSVVSAGIATHEYIHQDLLEK